MLSGTFSETARTTTIPSRDEVSDIRFNKPLLIAIVALLASDARSGFLDRPMCSIATSQISWLNLMYRVFPSQRSETVQLHASGTYGQQDAHTAASTATLYNIASLTKPITAQVAAATTLQVLLHWMSRCRPSGRIRTLPTMNAAIC